jgi:hypothetical protein
MTDPRHFAIAAGLASLAVGLLLILALRWWAKKFDATEPRDPAEWDRGID